MDHCFELPQPQAVDADAELLIAPEAGDETTVELFLSTTSMVPEIIPIQQLNLYLPVFLGVNSLTLTWPGVKLIGPSNKLLEITAFVQPLVPVSVISQRTGTPTLP